MAKKSYKEAADSMENRLQQFMALEIARFKEDCGLGPSYTLLRECMESVVRVQSEANKAKRAGRQ